MKKLILSMVLLASIATAFADTAIVLKKTNGNEVTFLIGEKPVAYPKANTLIMKSDVTEMEVNYVDIEKFYFKNVASGIKELMGMAAFSISNGEVIATGMNEGETLTICSINGTVIASAKADNQGVCHIIISELQKGSYIVKTNNNSYKFLKR